MASWRSTYPEKAELWNRMMDRTLPDDLEKQLLEAVPDEDTATRISGGKILQRAAGLCPGLIGGSADLAPSTKTMIEDAVSIGRDAFWGRNLHFGIREHGMGGILNGMALYGGFIPFGSTFLVFSDYMRPSIRLAALMEIPVIYIFTHDSIFVGEDGPTHQPVEHVSTLRAIPNLHVFRPADGYETAFAWAHALKREDGPTVLCLTRQTVPNIAAGIDAETMSHGGYILSRETAAKADIILVGTGSEVSVILDAKALLEEKNMHVRVVSVLSLDIFFEQDEGYRNEVIPTKVPVVVVEAALGQEWYRITRAPILHIGMGRFGASAPYNVLAEEFGFTGKSIAERVLDWFKQH